MRTRAPRSRPLLATLVTLLPALAVVAGCAPAFDGATYRGQGVAFRVGPVPPTWRRLDANGAALAFRDDAKDTTVGVNARCGVDGDDVPLGALTQHLFLHFTDRQSVKEEVVPFDGREALHSVVSAKLDGVAKTFDVWVLKKDGCVYDLYAISPPADAAAGAAPFERFVHGFTTQVSPHAD